MLKEIEINRGLKLAKDIPIIDVRSPAEFEKGHIPGATNIPLFSNSERAHVGTVYKKQSKEQAMKIGLKYVEPKLNYFIEKAKKLAPNKRIIVHCWRGGMRSKAFAKHLHDNGFEDVSTLIGGYKAFRNYALYSFCTKAKLCTLGGYTGSGKTYILYQLREMGEQIIDLEGLANHKGSAFGGIGQEKQPTIEQFENNLFWKWKNLNYSKTIWVEDESHRIGSVNIPMNFYENMKENPVLFVDIPQSERIKHLVKEYATCPKKELAISIEHISKRLGGENVKKALQYLESNNFDFIAEITLKYYDKYYLRGLNKRENQKNTFKLNLPEIDFNLNAIQIKEFYNENIRQKKYTPNSI